MIVPMLMSVYLYACVPVRLSQVLTIQHQTEGSLIHNIPLLLFLLLLLLLSSSLCPPSYLPPPLHIPSPILHSLPLPLSLSLPQSPHRRRCRDVSPGPVQLTEGKPVPKRSRTGAIRCEYSFSYSRLHLAPRIFALQKSSLSHLLPQPSLACNFYFVFLTPLLIFALLHLSSSSCRLFTSHLSLSSFFSHFLALCVC